MCIRDREDIAESLLPVYLKMIPYTAVQLVSYDVLVNGFVKGTLGVYGGEEGDGELFFALRLMSAIAAGVLATVASQPGDTIMTRRYCKEDEEEKECEAFVDDDNSVSGLFVGLRQRIPMTVLIVVTQLITVDYVKESLGV